MAAHSLLDFSYFKVKHNFSFILVHLDPRIQVVSTPSRARHTVNRNYTSPFWSSFSLLSSLSIQCQYLSCYCWLSWPSPASLISPYLELQNIILLWMLALH